MDNSQAETFAERAQGQKEQLWQDLAHRYFSGLHVMRELTRMQRVGPKAIMPVVFTSLLNLDNAGDETSGANRFGEPVYGITQTPQVYLDCMVEQDKGALIVNWDAVDELFPERMLDDMFRAFRHLLQDLADDDASWNRGFAENTRLLPADQLELRRQVNATEAPISDELLHTPFLQQVAERGDQLAVCTPSRRLTYAALYQMACRVERELLERGVKPNQTVGVLMAKGWEQVVAVLGIHFAAAAYVPINSELPAERQRFLMENGGVRIVLTQSNLMAAISAPEGVDVMAVDTMERLPNVALRPPRRRQKPGGSGLHHLYVGLDGRAQGRDDRSSRRDEHGAGRESPLRGGSEGSPVGALALEFRSLGVRHFRFVVRGRRDRDARGRKGRRPFALDRADRGGTRDGLEHRARADAAG